MDGVPAFSRRVPLDLRYSWAIYHDPPNDIAGGLSSVVVANHSCTIVEGTSEKSTGEFFLASFTNLTRDPTPHVGDENDVLQCRVTAELTEGPDIPSGDFCTLIVGDSMDVDDSSKLGSFPISVGKFSPEG